MKKSRTQGQDAPPPEAAVAPLDSAMAPAKSPKTPVKRQASAARSKVDVDAVPATPTPAAAKKAASKSASRPPASTPAAAKKRVRARAQAQAQPTLPPTLSQTPMSEAPPVPEQLAAPLTPAQPAPVPDMPVAQPVPQVLDVAALWEQGSPVKTRLDQLKTRNALLQEQFQRLRPAIPVRGKKK